VNFIQAIDNKKSKENFQTAFSLAKTETEKQVIQRKLTASSKIFLLFLSNFNLLSCYNDVKNYSILGVNKYTRKYIDECRSKVDLQISAYKKLVTTSRKPVRMLGRAGKP
jgi:hypothetical protein